MKPQYGDKRDYPKINIFVAHHNGKERYFAYAASTTWSRTCREARQRFYEKHYPKYALYEIKCRKEKP